jgi:hypothetical protein
MFTGLLDIAHDVTKIMDFLTVVFLAKNELDRL